jgi:MgtC family
LGLNEHFTGDRPVFRTHSLVCIASAILMIVTVYQNQWMTLVEHDAIRTDPTRMAQGIMTGIGFLGAGVIFKEGLTVRGLVMTETNVHKMIGDHGFTIANLSSRLSEGGQQFEYRMTIKSQDRSNAGTAIRTPAQPTRGH